MSTATTEKSTITTPDMHADDLRETLSNALLFSDNGYSLPVLSAVLLEFDGSMLTAVATDRYTIGIARCQSNVPAATYLLDRRDATDLVSLLRSRKPKNKAASPVGVDLTIDSTVLTVAFGDLTVRYTSHIDPGTFPKWRKFTETQERDAEWDGTVSFNPMYLARFARVTRERNEPMTVHIAGHKLARVEIGERFVGAIMPVRRAT